MQITKIQLFLFLLFLTLIIVDTKKDQHNTERNKKTYGEGEKLIAEVQHHISPGTGKFYLYLIICISLVLIAGLMSGLTIGLLSLNLRELEILKSVGDPNERKYAAKIIPLVRNHHWLLVTLLLCNSAAMEALPIFLDQLVNEILAIVLSTTAILFFGEIFPQALCSRYSLAIGARVAWPVRILTWITAPLSWTIGKLLDFILGHSSPPLYARYQLKELVSMHGQNDGGPLSTDESNIIKGAIDLREKTVDRAMTPIESVFMLNADSVYDESIVLEVLSEGHSRVPVYKDNKHNIIGILLTKRLLNIDLSTQRKVSDLELYKIPRVFDSTPMYDMLRLMQSGKSHMALIVDSEVYETNKKEVVNDQKKDELQVDLEDSTENKTPRNQPQLINEFESVISHDYHSGDDLSSIFNQSDKENMLESSEIDEMEGQKVIGIITLEDIFEELLQKEIVDETDVFVDVHQRVRVVEIFRKLSSSGPKFSHSKRKSSFTIPIAGLGNVNKKELMTNDEKLKLLKSSKKEK